MASRKDLKKEIYSVTEFLVEDCMWIGLNTPDKKEEMEQLIISAMEKQQELLARVKVKKQSKKEYNTIRRELLENADEVLRKTTSLSK